MTHTPEQIQITNATCPYGLVGPDCVTTFASLTSKAYHRAQIMYGIFGGFVVLFAMAKFVCAMRNLGSSLQKRVFLMMAYCSLTFIIRAIDPSSYGHVLPRYVTKFMSDSCTATIYSVCIMSCLFWMELIHERAEMRKLSSWVRFGAVVVHAVTWMFFSYDSVLLLQDPKQFARPGVQIKLIYGAVCISIVSFTGFRYGYRIYQRLLLLQAIHLQEMGDSPVPESDRTEIADSPTSLAMIEYDDTSSIQVLESGRPTNDFKARAREQSIEQLKKTTKMASRMCKILIVVVLGTVAAFAGQLYIAFHDYKHKSFCHNQLLCANGVRCSKLRLNSQYLCFLQAMGVSACLWVYRNVRRADSSDEA